MENNTHEPQPPALSKVEGPATLPAIRHDGWTGEKMAIFCETLAETAVVAEACAMARMGISGAYAARRRSPVFAAAWDAALTIARERLADTLLARSMEGNVEQLMRNGELVGERHFLDNRLGLAILRRLDRLADTGLSTSARGVRGAAAPAPRSQSVDWSLAIDAIRTDDDEGAARALAIKVDEVEEVEGPQDPLSQADEDEGIDLSARFRWDDFDEQWKTDFPPPPGFDGWQSRDYDDFEDDDPYERNCTPEETAILNADRAIDFAIERAAEEDLRDRWFQLLKEELNRHPDESQDP